MRKIDSAMLETYKQALEDIEGIAEKITERINEIIIIIHDVFDVEYPIYWSYRDRYIHSQNEISHFLPTFDDEAITYDVTYAADWPIMNLNSFNYCGAIPYDFLFRSNSDIKYIIEQEIIAQKRYELNKVVEKNKVAAEDAAIRKAALAKLSPVERAALGY